MILLGRMGADEPSRWCVMFSVTSMVCHALLVSVLRHTKSFSCSALDLLAFLIRSRRSAGRLCVLT